ncbi:MAG: hypothetical protein A2Y40_03030 [Candidatus Margulisbacteria bacterium GWF2_35_9]|nr:MAG: hypothetical protein A2Y40_03030 [Candidatus Margulisbacteria bacterium GWF2_35_9]
MTIVEPVIRPPSEARSFLLQVTIGCSSNQCTFCDAYKSKIFQAKPIQEIENDIIEGSRLYPNTRKVFLMDGDALVLSNSKLLPILELIIKHFPKLTRISSYANGDQISKRNIEELTALSQHKLTLFYIGLESGSQQILDNCKKRSSVEDMISAVNKSTLCNIKSSVIVLLGLGGKSRSYLHVKETIKAINKMQPRYLSFLSLMIVPGTDLYRLTLEGNFNQLSPIETLMESHNIIEGLDLNKTIFRSNHASNYLPLEGCLPEDKNRLLKELESTMQGITKIKPEYLRGL